MYFYCQIACQDHCNNWETYDDIEVANIIYYQFVANIILKRNIYRDKFCN